MTTVVHFKNNTLFVACLNTSANVASLIADALAILVSRTLMKHVKQRVQGPGTEDKAKSQQKQAEGSKKKPVINLRSTCL